MPRRKPPRVRTGQLHVGLSREEFTRRFRGNVSDPRFAAAVEHVDAVAEIAWRNYRDGRKAPRTVAAGRQFFDPTYQLSVDWLAARRSIVVPR